MEGWPSVVRHMIANHRLRLNSHRFKSYTFRHVEDTAEWSATGLENQGKVKLGRSIRLSSANGKVGQVVSLGGCKPLAMSISLCKFDSCPYHQIGGVGQLVESWDLKSQKYEFKSHLPYQNGSVG